jgi:serine-type D-Ala-D-Ala carboxypeptidase
MSEALHDLMARSQDRTFTACALVAIKRGETVIDTVWGDIEGEVAAPHTLFDLASLTKLFTMTAFLALVSEGKAALDIPLVQVIPEFGRISPRGIDGGRDPFSKADLPIPDHLAGLQIDPSRVTFWHLLTHTSGLAAWRDVYNAAGSAPTPPEQPDPIPRAERWTQALQALCDYPFIDQPGARVVYSDLGLMLLGEAVARLHDAPLDQAIKARVFDPLNLTDLCFNPVREYGISFNRIAPTENDPVWHKRRVWGEVHDENACGVGGVAGHAGLFGTARAVARFGQAWHTKPQIFSIAPDLAAAAKREQFITGDRRRGLGFVLRAREGSSASEKFSLNTYGHTGFTGTTLWIDPDNDLLVVLLTNNVYFGRDADTITTFRRAVHELLAEEFNR